MLNRSVRVIFDTNVWISFMIGRRLSILSQYISNEDIKIITCHQLLYEITSVTGRDKLKKYFPKESVIELIDLIETVSENIEIKTKHVISRDAKDKFFFIGLD